MLVFHFAHEHPSVRSFQSLCGNREEDHKWWFVEGRVRPEATDGDPDVVVVHRMKTPTPEWVSLFPGVPVIWVAWGDDYYRAFPGLLERVYSERTRRLAFFLGKVSITWPRLGMWMMNGGHNGNRNPSHWAGRVKMVSTLLGSGFPAMEFLPPGVSVLHSWYNAFDYERFGSLKVRHDAHSIILGNSGGLSGNHLDGMAMLRGAVGPEQDVRAVLAYGSKRARLSIRLIGWTQFGQQWNPLLKRMPGPQYLKWMTESFALVLPQWRSQSAGTLFLSLWIGHRIFLHSRNPLFSVLKEKGFKVFDIEQLGEAGTLTPLPESEIEHNRNLLKLKFNNEAIHASLDDAFDGIRNGLK